MEINLSKHWKSYALGYLSLSLFFSLSLSHSETPVLRIQKLRNKKTSNALNAFPEKNKKNSEEQEVNIIVSLYSLKQNENLITLNDHYYRYQMNVNSKESTIEKTLQLCKCSSIVTFDAKLAYYYKL